MALFRVRPRLNVEKNTGEIAKVLIQFGLFHVVSSPFRGHQGIVNTFLSTRTDITSWLKRRFWKNLYIGWAPL